LRQVGQEVAQERNAAQTRRTGKNLKSIVDYQTHRYPFYYFSTAYKKPANHKTGI
jgi:hypothetical protein